MNEEEWLACRNPYDMLFDLHSQPPGKVPVAKPDRKLRLFCCACCRRVWHLLDDERSRKAIEVVERYVDGLATPEELLRAGDAAEAAWKNAVEKAYAVGPLDPALFYVPVPAVNALLAAAYTAGRRPDCEFPAATWYGMAGLAADKCRAAILFAASEAGRDQKPHTQAEMNAHLMLLRDCFANPFKPVVFDSAWRSSVVVSLTRTIYEERAFERMPVLADALVKAGCTNLDILDHCREFEPHIRGCWVVDSVLEN